LILNSTENTGAFSIPAASYAAVYARRYAALGLTIAALPLLCAIVAGFSDIRWWLIALMCLLIVYPMVLTMAWLALMARPAMSMRLRPQVWHFLPGGGFAVDFLRCARNGEDNSYAPEIAASLTISSNEITKAAVSGRFYALYLRQGCDFDFLLIPSALMPEALVNHYISQ